MRRNPIFGITVAGLIVNTIAIADDYSIRSATEWRSATATADGVAVAGSGLALKDGLEGEWTSAWHEWSSAISSATVPVHTDVDLFNNKTIDVLVDGSETPFTDRESSR